MSENALLREFAATRSDTAFAALVRQHVNLVFATALRQVGDRSLAEEISQDFLIEIVAIRSVPA
ncbi:MAG: hypothetical protein L0Z50_40265 [Verrucomicrobiales bacterium]|nr:hypothetical protein [Verrucomicrobiales bacterium]